jgi:hypothetical protein
LAAGANLPNQQAIKSNANCRASEEDQGYNNLISPIPHQITGDNKNGSYKP